MSAGVSQTSSACRERALDDALGSGAVDAVEERDGAVRLAQPLGALGEASERPRRRLRVGEGGDMRLLAAKRLAGCRSALSTTASTGFSLGRLSGRAVDRFGDLVGRCGHGRDEENDDGVDLRVREQERQRRRVGLRGGAAEHVDRVVDAGLGREERRRAPSASRR